MVRHAGFAHFVVHFFELCPNRDFAVLNAAEQADLLRSQWPACGHLLHMASHIDMLGGDYQGAILANVAGIEQDDAYERHLESTETYYHTYTLHNHHMLCWAAMFAGDFEAAKFNARAIGHWNCSRGFFDWLLFFMDGFVTTSIVVFIRFGKWREIIEYPLPKDPERFCVFNAFLVYAKGIAHAVLGHVDEVSPNCRAPTVNTSKYTHLEHEIAAKCVHVRLRDRVLRLLMCTRPRPVFMIYGQP